MKFENELLKKLNGHKVQITELVDEKNVNLSPDIQFKESVFNKTDQEKTEIISYHFAKIMNTLGLDLNDNSLKDSPYRVAKMFVKEIFYGLNLKNRPNIKVFENKFKYGEMLVEKNIKVNSSCEHHFLPIIGKAHVAYISSGTIIGLSKLNRIVDYYSRRPQVQERLTRQIAEELKLTLKTEDVAVFIEAKHMCVSFRGIQDENSTTVTSEYCGKFKEEKFKSEFLRYIEYKL